MAGERRTRVMWENYYKETDAIVFVFDCHDFGRVVETRDELNAALEHKDLKNRKIPVLIFANKSDLLEIKRVDTFSEFMRLHRIQNKPFRFCFCSALTRCGVDDGMDWLCEKLEEAT